MRGLPRVVFAEAFEGEYSRVLLMMTEWIEVVEIRVAKLLDRKWSFARVKDSYGCRVGGAEQTCRTSRHHSIIKIVRRIKQRILQSNQQGG